MPAVRLTVPIVFVLGLAIAGPVLAADPAVYVGLEIEYLVNPEGTGSRDTASVSSYIELEYGGLYAGLAAELTEDRESREFAPYFGYRGSLSDRLSYDLYYTHYTYPALPEEDYGEAGLTLELAVGEAALVAGDVFFYPETGLWSAYVTGTVPLGEKFEGSASIGLYEVEEAQAETEWEVGVTYYPTEEIGIDLRYYDGSEYVSGYLGLSITFDTTLFGG